MIRATGRLNVPGLLHWTLPASASAQEMAAAGLDLTLNSDDPAFIESDLGDDDAPARAFGYDSEAIVAIAQARVDATWLTPSEKASVASESLPRRWIQPGDHAAMTAEEAGGRRSGHRHPPVDPAVGTITTGCARPYRGPCCS